MEVVLQVKFLKKNKNFCFFVFFARLSFSGGFYSKFVEISASANLKDSKRKSMGRNFHHLYSCLFTDKWLFLLPL